MGQRIIKDHDNFQFAEQIPSSPRQTAEVRPTVILCAKSQTWEWVKQQRNEGPGWSKKLYQKVCCLSLGASRGVWNPVERPFVPVPRSPKRRRRAGGTCFGWLCLGSGALHGSLSCSGRDPLCESRSSGRAAVCAVFPVMCGSAWTRSCKLGTGSMTCTLPVTSSWSISSRSEASRALPVSPTRRSGGRSCL